MYEMFHRLKAKKVKELIEIMEQELQARRSALNNPQNFAEMEVADSLTRSARWEVDTALNQFLSDHSPEDL